MCIQTTISWSTDHSEFFLRFSVQTCLWILKSFGEPEINDKNYILFLALANKKVLWLDITVNEVFLVHAFNPSDHLDSDMADGFGTELISAELEQLANSWTEDVHNQDIEFSFYSKPMHLWNARN